MYSGPFPLATIVRRELLTSLRSWKSFILLLLLLLALFYLASEVMETTAQWGGASQAMRRFFQVQVWSLYGVAMAIVPALAAVTVNSERESGNWDLLATTLIPPSRIVLGKYIAVLVFFVLLCVAVLPLTGLVYFYAGVDTYELRDALLRIVPAALCNAALGLWASQRYPSPSRAVMNAFGLVFVYSSAFFVGAAFYRFQLLPFPGGVILPATAAMIPPEYLFAAYQAALGALFLALALLGARQRKTAFEQTIHSTAEQVRHTRQQLFPPRPVTIPDQANPFGYRDVIGNPSRNPTVALATFLVTGTGYGLVYAFLAQNAPGMEAGLGIIERIGVLFLFPPLVAIAVVRDREETTLDLYRMTLLHGSDFLRGKLVGVVRQLAPILAAYFLAKLIATILQTNGAIRLEYGPPVMVFWLDLLLMPLHMLLVLATALAGAVFPRSLVAAIGAASGAVFAGFLFFAMLQAGMMGGGGGELETIVVFLLTHLTLSVFALFVAFGIAIVRVSFLWSARP